MSRTDKDLPYWYAERYEAEHHCSAHKHIECDLPSLGIKSPANLVRYARRVQDRANVPPQNWPTRCTWEPCKRVEERYWWRAPPPKWYRDHRWNNPERVRVRDEGRAALKDYNANAEIEKDFQNFQHRHNAAWDYW